MRSGTSSALEELCCSDDDKTAKDRKNIYDGLRDAYDLRSAIVHGDDSKENELVPGGLWENRLRPVRCYDREAIVYFHKLGCLDNSVKRLEHLTKRFILHAKIE